MRNKSFELMHVTSFAIRLFFAAVTAVALMAPTNSRAQNTATGTGALSSNTTGTNNAAFGFDALNSNTTGNYNSAFGYGALSANTTSIGNTAVGGEALQENTGIYNTAIGLTALEFNTTGYYNVASGAFALGTNTTGSQNVATGYEALYHNNGTANTASGMYALFTNTSGGSNVATGASSLYSNTTGAQNTSTGLSTMYFNTTGSYNAAHGLNALYSNTTGNYNTADGWESLYSNATGTNNIALGVQAGYSITGSENIDIGNDGVAGESNVIRIGASSDQTSTYIAGISGVTSTSGVAVYINASGQLGTVVSSRRFKYDINDLGDISDKLMKLRPVTFRYKQAAPDGSHPIQYGLIAEEVAEVSPDLVQYDKEGKPFTVYYNLLTPLLLNEFQKAHRRTDAQQTAIDSLKSDLHTQRAELDALKRAQQQQSPFKAPIALGFVGFAFAGCVMVGRSRKTN